jgi:hypothetical protein
MVRKFILIAIIVILLAIILYPKPVGNPKNCIGYISKNHSLGILGRDDNGNQYGEVIFTYYCYGIFIPR